MDVTQRQMKSLSITGANNVTIRLKILRQFCLSLAIERDTLPGLVSESFTLATGKVTICQTALEDLDLNLNHAIQADCIDNLKNK